MDDADDRDGVQGSTSGWERDAEEQVRDVLGAYRGELRGCPSDEDLINSRRIDSLTFVSVMYGLIDRSGRDIDLDRIASAELRTISGMARVFFGPPGDDVRVRVSS